MNATQRRSTLALAVLSLLREAEYRGMPAMHPYKMQRLIKDRGKGEVVNVGQRASLYRTIERLQRSRLVEARESSREHNRPEKTLYALTDEGRATWREWMLDALANPTRDFPEFPAALAFIPLLTPDEVLRQLEKREEKLSAELSRIQTVMEDGAEWGRLFMLEMEYLRATTAAELEWVRSVANDLRSAEITWDEESLLH
ncbi:PadR family transcriptional regulator [Nonomuraea jiangxiensis]|uniref:DNA-binding transcriptional regulator, PadR family n=1 Tax=Nonomuraea jiangxiensis TaxID=633440 RepID=A0A1G9VTD5_9ACTN|nr:PadR family transcriptional regulator [Nonomuraea jiangxiensis]SDM75221.1 DNA-binding transcriptional regulator, PadR family [Nonomuraea jiangxiensis]